MKPDAAASVSSVKNKLRAEARQIPSDPEVQKRESAALVSILKSQPEIQAASAIGIFYPFATEPDLLGLFAHFPGKLLFPKVRGNTMDFYRVQAASELAPGYQRIPEPAGDPKSLYASWKKTDLILIPGVLFDRAGGRLGSGKGFYDRYVGALRPSPTLWGVCLSPYVSAQSLPQESTDAKLAGLLTASGLLTF